MNSRKFKKYRRNKKKISKRLRGGMFKSTPVQNTPIRRRRYTQTPPNCENVTVLGGIMSL